MRYAGLTKRLSPKKSRLRGENNRTDYDYFETLHLLGSSFRFIKKLNSSSPESNKKTLFPSNFCKKKRETSQEKIYFSKKKHPSYEGNFSIIMQNFQNSRKD